MRKIMTGIRQQIFSNVSGLKKLRQKGISQKVLKKVNVRLNSRINGIIVKDNSTGKVVETQSIIDRGKYHGLNVNEALILYLHDAKKTMLMHFDSGLVIQRNITKNIEEGFVRVEYALRSSFNDMQDILSYKRVTNWFDTDGKKFLKFSHKTSEVYDHPNFFGFKSIENIQNYFDRPILSKSIEPAKTMEEASSLLDRYFKNPLKPLISNVRKDIGLEIVHYPKNLYIFSEKMGKKLMKPLRSQRKITGQSIFVKSTDGKVAETHNIFNRLLNPNYKGLPLSHSVNIFQEHKGNQAMIMLYDKHFKIHRIVTKDINSGHISILTSLSKESGNNFETLSQIKKTMKFEVVNGKFKQLLSRNTYMADYKDFKGFAHTHSNGKSKMLDYWDDNIRGIKAESNGQNSLIKILEKPNTKTLRTTLKGLLNQIKDIKSIKIVGEN